MNYIVVKSIFIILDIKELKTVQMGIIWGFIWNNELFLMCNHMFNYILVA